MKPTPADIKSAEMREYARTGIAMSKRILSDPNSSDIKKKLAQAFIETHSKYVQILH